MDEEGVQVQPKFARRLLAPEASTIVTTVARRRPQDDENRQQDSGKSSGCYTPFDMEEPSRSTTTAPRPDDSRRHRAAVCHGLQPNPPPVDHCGPIASVITIVADGNPRSSVHRHSQPDPGEKATPREDRAPRMRGLLLALRGTGTGAGTGTTTGRFHPVPWEDDPALEIQGREQANKQRLVMLGWSQTRPGQVRSGHWGWLRDTSRRRQKSPTEIPKYRALTNTPNRYLIPDLLTSSSAVTCLAQLWAKESGT